MQGVWHGDGRRQCNGNREIEISIRKKVKLINGVLSMLREQEKGDQLENQANQHYLRPYRTNYPSYQLSSSCRFNSPLEILLMFYKLNYLFHTCI